MKMLVPFYNFRLRRSYLGLLLDFLLHLGAGMVVWTFPLGGIAQSVLELGVIGSWVWGMSRYWLFWSNYSVVELGWGDGEWQIRRRGNPQELLRVVVLYPVGVFSGLVILRLREVGRKRTFKVPIFRDALADLSQFYLLRRLLLITYRTGKTQLPNFEN